jgi:hypothetical protein
MGGGKEMKKSAKQRLKMAATCTSSSSSGKYVIHTVRYRAVLRIIRSACNEAKRVGIQAGYQCAEDAKVLGGKKAAMELADEIASLHVSEIINGPKKGKRK